MHEKGLVGPSSSRRVSSTLKKDVEKPSAFKVIHVAVIVLLVAIAAITIASGVFYFYNKSQKKDCECKKNINSMSNDYNNTSSNPVSKPINTNESSSSKCLTIPSDSNSVLSKVVKKEEEGKVPANNSNNSDSPLEDGSSELQKHDSMCNAYFKVLDCCTQEESKKIHECAPSTLLVFLKASLKIMLKCCSSLTSSNSEKYDELFNKIYEKYISPGFDKISINDFKSKKDLSEKLDLIVNTLEMKLASAKHSGFYLN